MPETTARRLPAGVFYILAGPNPVSLNLWQANRTGVQIRLTRNRPEYGISTFGASAAGIVLADASGGVDELARLTSHGVVFLKNAYGGSPQINPQGLIAYIRPPLQRRTPYFALQVRRTFTARARTRYRQLVSMGSEVWGPDGQLAVLSSPHPPGINAPKEKLLVVSAAGKPRYISPGYAFMGAPVWSPEAPGIAVADDKGDAQVVTLTGHREPLPKGWLPEAWSPDGARLLVMGHDRLGLWAPTKPRSVDVIGTVQSKAIDEIAWLSHPAQM